MAVLLAPVVLFSMARSPNALFSLEVLFVERFTAMGVVEGTTYIGKERERTDGVVFTAICVVFKGSRSKRRVI